MLRVARNSRQLAGAALRWSGAQAQGSGKVRRDLFGYEQSSETGPYIEKIKQTKFYDDAGDIIVEMNLKNCPPDLVTYNTLIQKIFEAPSKRSEPMEGESKFAAMMDVMEEMAHRYRTKPSVDTWTPVLKELERTGQWRLGLLACLGMEHDGVTPPAELKAKFEEKQRTQSDRPITTEPQPADIFDVKVVTF